MNKIEMVQSAITDLDIEARLRDAFPSATTSVAVAEIDGEVTITLSRSVGDTRRTCSFTTWRENFGTASAMRARVQGSFAEALTVLGTESV